MRFKKIAASAVVLAGVLVPATQADAATPPTTPPTSGIGTAGVDVFVLWQNPNFTGGTHSNLFGRENYNGLVFGGTVAPVDNNGSSAANYDTTIGVRAFEFVNRGGSSIFFLPKPQVGGGRSWFYANLGQFDDRISSHTFTN